MKRIAIVGAGPTGLYTFFSLLQGDEPLCIAIYEQADKAGIGMPYNGDENIRLMLANIASIEIPPLTCSYLDWLLQQDRHRLARYGIDKSGLHDRQFLPRLLLGEYFRDQFLAMVEQGRERGCDISVYESCRVTDLEAQKSGVLLWTEGAAEPVRYDLAAIATGHVWPDEDEATRSYFPSPWSGLLDAEIAACKVGIMGTSLSAVDAAMAVVVQHGSFIEGADNSLHYESDEGGKGLVITLMSRTGILPEADFYCPIPYEPLHIATPAAIDREIAAGEDGLLDRVFALMVSEIEAADPDWSQRVALSERDADSFADAYFADRKRFDPFRWAEYNLKQVEANKRDRYTVPWRYAILRLHEAVQDIVPHFDEGDRERFVSGLSRVFVDNYAAIPPETIRRLLALRQAGIIGLLELGPDYEMAVKEDRTLITADATTHTFDLFIDARGQKPLGTKDLPFPRLRRQLLAVGEDIPDVGEDYTLLAPDIARGRIAFGALPYLMHDQPFIQGVTASAEIGSKIAQAASRSASRTRWRLPAGN